MKRIFITGGTGFIGRPIVEILKSHSDIELYILSRQQFADTERIHYIQGNITDEQLLSSVIAHVRPITLLHLAWDVKSAGYANSIQNEEWTEWSKNLLKTFLQYGGKTVVASGTCFEYDFSLGRSLREDDFCVPSTPYGKAKLATYHVYEDLCRKHNARMVWGRIFYPYGRGEEKRKLFSAVTNALKNHKSFFCKTPENNIDYIHIYDVAKIFVAFLLNDEASGIVNVGTGKRYKIRDILMKIARMLRKEELLQFTSNNGICIVADTYKLSSFYDCNSFIELDEGLKYLFESTYIEGR